MTTLGILHYKSNLQSHTTQIQRRTFVLLLPTCYTGAHLTVRKKEGL